MTKSEHDSKLFELEQLLNDPEVPMQPARVWALLAELAEQERKQLVPPRRLRRVIN